MGHYNNGQRGHYTSYRVQSHRTDYRSNGNNFDSYESHQTGGQKCLRALLSVITAIGFGMFWYALVTGLEGTVLFFVGGIISIIIGIIHIFIGIGKDRRHRR